jgi:hypothetical protein
MPKPTLWAVLVVHEPLTATAWLASQRAAHEFSDAIISKPVCWRCSSLSMRAAMSGSKLASGSLSIVMGSVHSPGRIRWPS